ncbi:MAG: hypothetical protein ACR2PX_10660 [Endozoicomonas sp.]|uniref:hypothetical protein n=1 Tax=Endozoicomonas sp. TaxID=1892382 RepID=UPI003D9BE347
MINNTKNHHFVSQVEQRMNSINSDISKNNQRIYSFSITDREKYEVELDSENGVKIRENLSFDDLFTIEVIDSSLRANLEDAFGRYETNLSKLTDSLLSKIKAKDSNISNELLNIFALKFINTFRNPFCIEKTLNTIGLLSKHIPTDKKLNNHYSKIDTSNAISIRKYAQKFNVTEAQYREWLKCLFMLLIPKKVNDDRFIDQFIKDFFTERKNSINILISTYSERFSSVLLSDRSFTFFEDPKGHIVYEFNLTSNTFISYIFTDLTKFIKNKRILNSILKFNSEVKPDVRVNYRTDALDLLSAYNKRVVYQSFNTVYCKNQKIYGL